MGLLVDGKWVDQWYDTRITGGRFVRKEAPFRSWVTSDGSAGPSGLAGFKAEAGRYQLYVSYACPWAHRTLIFRALKGLEELIDVSIVNWIMHENGWTFEEQVGVIQDPVKNARFMHEIYTTAKPDYTGRVTVPVLFDKKKSTIVSNESSEIIRMFNSAFDGIGAKEGDYYPENLRADIDQLNKRIYETINNGVYRAGFATNQEAYEEAVYPLFESLDWVEGILADKPYLAGEIITEADWRLFTTLVRFDAVYVRHFNCNIKRIADYPYISSYLKKLYEWPGVKETVRMDHIKGHYFESHKMINPTGIVPVGPDLPFMT
ncbi:MAG: glutathione S-transferase family protein [Alphaproteobacteria bacterium]